MDQVLAGIAWVRASAQLGPLTFISMPRIDALLGFSTHSCGFVKPSASMILFDIQGFPAVDLLRVTKRDRMTCVSGMVRSAIVLRQM